MNFDDPFADPGLDIRETVFAVDRLTVEFLVDEMEVHFMPPDKILGLNRVRAVAQIARMMETTKLRFPLDWKEGAREAWRRWVSLTVNPACPWLAGKIRGREPRYKTYEAVSYLPKLEIPPDLYGGRFRVQSMWMRR